MSMIGGNFGGMEKKNGNYYLGFWVSRENGNRLYIENMGIQFPYSLATPVREAWVAAHIEHLLRVGKYGAWLNVFRFPALANPP